MSATVRHMKTKMALRYEGPALNDGQMDVYQTSANMIAFTEFIVAAVKETYGDSAEVKAEVSGFEPGSFVTNLVFQVAGNAATIFTALSPDQIWEVLKGAFDLWKHLKGEPPASVEQHGPTVTVTNNNGQIFNVKTEAFNLVLNVKATEAAQRFIGQPLAEDGITGLTISGDQFPVPVAVTESEAGYFVPVTKTVQLSDNTNRMVLTVISPVFQDGNKWRFSDGGPSFSASILDGDFLMQVDKGFERFGKGDVLEAEVRIVQTRTGVKVSVEREVLRVIRHINPHEQSNLL